MSPFKTAADFNYVFSDNKVQVCVAKNICDEKNMSLVGLLHCSVITCICPGQISHVIILAQWFLW